MNRRPRRLRRHLPAGLLLSLLLSLPLSALPAAAGGKEPPAWPWPQDVPRPGNVAPAPAGRLPYDIVRFLMVRSVRAPRLSPDGRRLAFIADITGVPQLWVVDAEGGWPRQLTFGRGVTFHRWLPDGSGLLYAADHDGNEKEAFHLISPDGLKERLVLPHDGSFRAFGAFSPDGRRFVFSSTRRNGTDFDLYVADLETGGVRLVREGRFGWFAAAWQPGGDLVLVREIRGEDGNDLHLLDMATGRLTTLFRPEVPSWYGDFAWDPDGRGFYLATDHERDFRGLAHYDPARGELRWIETPPHDVENVTLAGDGRWLAWTTNEGGWSRLHVRDLATGRDLTPPQELPTGVFSLSGARRAARLAIRVSGPKVPGDAWVWDLETGRLHRATRATMAGIDPDSLVTPESVFFEARDGVRLHGLLYLPPAPGPRANGRTVATKPPVVVRVHGGPTGQARPSFRPVIQYLVGRSIAVLDLDFRGSTGFGKTFARLDNGRQRPRAVRDLVDALAFLARDGRVDATRAAVMGGSYGGFLVNAVLGMYPDAFRAGVSFVGVSDWVRALEEASPALKASDRLEYGDVTDPEWRAFFREISPITHADRIRAPMLVAHGVNDPRDPVAESDRLVRKVRARGVPVIYFRFPDEGHGVRRLANRVALYRAVARFLERELLAAGDDGGAATAREGRPPR